MKYSALLLLRPRFALSLLLLIYAMNSSEGRDGFPAQDSLTLKESPAIEDKSDSSATNMYLKVDGESVNRTADTFRAGGSIVQTSGPGADENQDLGWTAFNASTSSLDKDTQAALGFGDVFDLANRIPIAVTDTDVGLQDSEADRVLETITDHKPVVCDGTEVVEGSVGEICDKFQQAWSCKDKCSFSIKSPCSCDVNCLLHNTCCLDFEEHCPDLAAYSIEERAGFPGLQTACDLYLSSPVVSQCPEGASEEEKRLCGMSRQNASSLLDVAPVSDSFYLWSFKNKHCWRCWNTGHSALRWRVNITMNFRNRMSEDYRLDSLISFMADNQDKVYWYPPNGIVKRQCTDKVVSHCSACWPDDATVDKCVNGPHAYLHTPSGVYKNMYCYLCSKHRQAGVKVTCRAKEVETIIMHGLNFPVTMIIPDGDDANDLKLIQKEYIVGSFLWDKMSCSLSDGFCQAQQCMSSTLVSNGRCDRGLTPLMLHVEICMADLSDGGLACKTQDSRIEAGLYARHDKVLDHVTSYAADLFGAYGLENATLVESTVSETVDSGLEVILLWSFPYLIDIEPAMIRQSVFEMTSVVDHISGHGWLAVCTNWGKSSSRMEDVVSPYKCGIAMLCQPDSKESAVGDEASSLRPLVCFPWILSALLINMAFSLNVVQMKWFSLS